MEWTCILFSVFFSSEKGSLIQGKVSNLRKEERELFFPSTSETQGGSAEYNETSIQFAVELPEERELSFAPTSEIQERKNENLNAHNDIKKNNVESITNFQKNDEKRNQFLISDPYEDQMVQIQRSNINSAQEGLFSKNNVEENTLLCFYNGERTFSDEDFKLSKEVIHWQLFEYCSFFSFWTLGIGCISFSRVKVYDCTYFSDFHIVGHGF